MDARGGLVWDSERVSTALRVGDQSHFNGDQARVALDGSYLSMLFSDWQMYGGWIDKWYGPGWTSSLILSNNARPFPKIGVMRNSSHAFESPWLSWIGLWQLDFSVGMLDGPRVDSDTGLGSLRIVFSPLRNLDIGLTRITEFCGANHPCSPLKAAFQFGNSSSSNNSANEEAAIDVKYSRVVGKVNIAPYLQLMNEDTGPFSHAVTSYLAGASLAGPLGQSGAQWRMTIEYADSVATLNWFDFGKKAYGDAYNNFQYTDGMRYRDRTLGFSLDSDSRLFSITDSIIDSQGWVYRVIYYRANISSQQLSAMQQQGGFTRNSVSTAPLLINEGEVGISIPWYPFTINVAIRGQDAKLSPDQNSKIAGEASISYRF